MGIFKLKWKANEKGISLVEVLASIVILTLLLTTFLMMFVQSAKTNKKSEEIIDATYIAQTEMENIYAVSRNPDFIDRKTAMKSLYQFDEIKKHYYTNKNNMYIEVRFKDVKLEEEKIIDDLIGIIVVVRESQNDEKVQAQMETILYWEADVDE
ncbi:prepilin-type N-terminal cleavage/methylation domain-containing protein [Sporosarcina sp. 6E9]|uniref:prepilin-type N-terminal cleavage/methylation domain-containing protein n=1 Tax=Sporosarcina sp. 6E9 TaxID=2819235 RepID=UPI001B31701F|nr:prepilin-type N-terminal cleavage/methylation domain-containing protein [Sporosarcina sp. 6E9]